jgi:hypothetical protein
VIYQTSLGVTYSPKPGFWPAQYLVARGQTSGDGSPRPSGGIPSGNCCTSQAQGKVWMIWKNDEKCASVAAQMAKKHENTSNLIKNWHKYQEISRDSQSET